MMTMTFKKMVNPDEIAEFWRRKQKYHDRDIFPSLSEEDIRYFNSKKYYDIIMDLHQTPKNGSVGLQFVFFYQDLTYLGFTMYKIYPQEDGKAFILDYCIEPSYRNQGLGSQVFQELERLLTSEGALFVELNSGEPSEPDGRFWVKQGFIPKERDEDGVMLYLKSS